MSNYIYHNISNSQIKIDCDFLNINYALKVIRAIYHRSEFSLYPKFNLKTEQDIKTFFYFVEPHNFYNLYNDIRYDRILRLGIDFDFYDLLKYFEIRNSGSSHLKKLKINHKKYQEEAIIKNIIE